MKAEFKEDAYHALFAEDVLAGVKASPTGLSATEAAQRLRLHGPNELPAAPARHPIVRFLSHFNNALIYFLLAAAVVTWTLGHFVDGSVILAVVLVNAIVGFIQEGKAESALNAIRSMVSPQATVMWDGHRSRVSVADLVPGDIVLVEAGDRVPADLRLIHARGLLIEEAILTGESVAAEKSEGPVPVEAALGDRSSMAYFGTMVAAGQGRGVVVATGVKTEMGRISTLLVSVQELTTPLLRQINRFARRFTWATISGAVLLFLFAVFARGFAWPDALIAIVALAVGLCPRGCLLLSRLRLPLASAEWRRAMPSSAVCRLSKHLGQRPSFARIKPGPLPATK